MKLACAIAVAVCWAGSSLNTASAAPPTAMRIDDIRPRIQSCVASSLLCGQTMAGELGPSDCTFSDGTYFDTWTFAGSADTIVEITITAVDGTYTTPLVTIVPPGADASKTPLIFASGSSVVLDYVLASTGTWTIGVGTHDLTAHGRYSIRLDCFPDDAPGEPQNCIEQTLSGCPQSLLWYLTASGCRFSDGSGPYQYETFTSRAPGDQFTFTALSSDFAPALAIYSHAGPTPLVSAFAPSGGSQVTLSFSPPSRGDYDVTVFGRTNNAVGFFALQTSCSLACSGPTITANPTSVTVPYNSAVTLSVGASGTGPLSYRWYDVNDPITTLSTGQQVLTPRLLKTTTFAVDVTSPCGNAKATAIVTVQQPPRRRAVHH